MGKSSRNLKNERKQIFKEYTTSELISHDDSDENYSDYETFEDRIINTAYDIRLELFEYTSRDIIPLCEYLDMDNVINFVEWVLNQ